MYKVNEIFYSLQGEGFWTGTPMVFVRLSGCNLRCAFCDTDHAEGRMMEIEEIVEQVKRLGGQRICLTGGEPALQADEAMIKAFHEASYRVHVETNGTRPLPPGIDWITLSPKDGLPGVAGKASVCLERAHEVKLVFTPELADEKIEKWARFPADWHYLQPCDSADPARNAATTAACVEQIKKRPEWRLSLQTHKLLGIK